MFLAVRHLEEQLDDNEIDVASWSSRDGVFPTTPEPTTGAAATHDDDTSEEEDLRFWQEEPAKDQVIPVLIGLGVFVLMCIGLCLWHGPAWVRVHCRSRRQSVPQHRHPQGPILMRR